MSPERRVGISVIELKLDVNYCYDSTRLLLKEDTHQLVISKKEVSELAKLDIRVVLLVDVNDATRSREMSNEK